MRTKILLVVTTLVGAVVLLLVLLARVDRPPVPTVEEAATVAAAAATPNWTSTFIEGREPVIASQPERAPVAQPLQDEPDPSELPLPKDRIVELFESLNLSSGYWDAFHSLRSFTQLDLSRVQSLVAKNELGAGELIDTFRRVDPSSELRPMIVLACAFSADVKPVDIDRLQLLAGVDHDARTLHQGTLAPASSYAATLALWMLDAQSELSAIARESLSRYLDLSPLENRPNRSAFLRDSAALALDTVEVSKSAELRRHLGTALGGDPTEIVTEAAWRLHGRSADRAVRTEILEQASAGDGMARLALESIRSDASAAALEDLARSAPDTEPGNALAESACVALISTSTSKSWRAFERVWHSAQRRPLVWDALGRVDRPQNLANLLVRSSQRARTPYEQSFDALIESCIEVTQARLARCTVSAGAVRETCKNLRAILSEIADDPESMDVALGVLVAHGEDTDRRLAWSMSRYLSESALRNIQASLSAPR